MKAVIVAIAVIFAMPVSSLAGQVSSNKEGIRCGLFKKQVSVQVQDKAKVAHSAVKAN